MLGFRFFTHAHLTDRPQAPKQTDANRWWHGRKKFLRVTTPKNYTHLSCKSALAVGRDLLVLSARAHLGRKFVIDAQSGSIKNPPPRIGFEIKPINQPNPIEKCINFSIQMPPIDRETPLNLILRNPSRSREGPRGPQKINARPKTKV